jgi:putative membrane protein insertion efficiency factor
MIKLLKCSAILLIRFYQILLSPLLGNYKCRFNPTCSKYMIEAIEKKGLIKGFFAGMLRLSKCHPFSKKSGFDPV